MKLGRSTRSAAAVGALLSLITVTVAPAGAQDDGPADARQTGTFSIVFRPEDATYLGDDGTWRSLVTDAPAARGDNGCITAEDGTQDCLPAAATSVGLASGDVLYWNALQGTENLSLTQSAVPAGGNIAENEDSRLLRLDPSDPARSTVAVPEGANGFTDDDRQGAEEQGLVPNPLEPGTFILPTNPEGAPPNSNGLFCSDQLHLSSGQILAIGGTNYYSEPSLGDALRVAGLGDVASQAPEVEDVGVIELEGTRDARLYDPAAGPAGAWTSIEPMEYGRWYPSGVTLADGDVLVASGVTKLIKPMYTDDDIADSGDNVPYLERFDTEDGSWSVEAQDGAKVRRTMPLYPRLHLLPNGHVYYDAGGQAFNPAGESYAEALWNIAAAYDPGTKTWTDLGVPGLQGAGSAVDGDGNFSEPGFRGSTFSAMLPLRPGPDGSYDEAAVLSAGGVLLPTPGSVLPTSTSRVNQVHLRDGAMSLETVPTGPLGRARWYGSGVVLPNGQVALFNGADLDAVVAPGYESAIRQVELFTPEYAADDPTVVTGGAWEDVAMQTRGRTYHNSAILLPDASVLVGGHAPIPNSYAYVMDTPDIPGVRDFANNFRDASFEIYYPPYLHHGDRPEIASADDSVAHDGTLRLTTRDDIESVVLVRNPSYTHLIDGDQRSVELPFDVVDRPADGVDEVRAAVPGPEVVPPGPYMVFVNQRIDGELVPSVSHQVFVGADAPAFARDGAGVFDDGPFQPTAGSATAGRTVEVGARIGAGTDTGADVARNEGRGAGAVVPGSASRTPFSPAADRRSPGTVPLGLSVLAVVVGIGAAWAGVARRRGPDIV